MGQRPRTVSPGQHIGVHARRTVAPRFAHEQGPKGNVCTTRPRAPKQRVHPNELASGVHRCAALVKA